MLRREFASAERANVLSAAAAFCLSVICLPSSGSAQATAVAIDPAETHQTIEGFGSMLKSDIGPEDITDLRNATFRQFLMEDFGFTVFRPWLPMTPFEPTNDNSDPNTLNMSGFVLCSQMQFIIECINLLKSYPDVKFIPAVLSPPAWMKDNNDIANGSLRTDMYEEFAEYLVAFYRIIKQETGMDLYGISMQNESAFDEWYGSCKYTAQQYRDVLKVVGARFAAENIQTRLHGADDMLTNITINPYFGIINQDPVAKSYLSAASVHGYSDGVSPMPTSGAAQAWARLGTISRAMGIPAWMNEAAGWQPNDYMPAALHVGMGLKYADLTMWVHLDMDDCAQWGLLCNDQHTLRSAAMKHYYHFVRPGAVRIGATYTADDYLLVNAFVHADNDKMTVVAVNNASSSRQIQLSGTGLPAQMQMYLTTSTGGNKLCEDQGNTSTGSAITLPAHSVVTLEADYVTAVQPRATRAAPSVRRVPVSAGSRTFLIDGSAVRGAGSARGIRVVDTPEGAAVLMK